MTWLGKKLIIKSYLILLVILINTSSQLGSVPYHFNIKQDIKNRLFNFKKRSVKKLKRLYAQTYNIQY